jgi:hypothetical protein
VQRSIRRRASAKTAYPDSGSPEFDWRFPARNQRFIAAMSLAKKVVDALGLEPRTR